MMVSVVNAVPVSPLAPRPTRPHLSGGYRLSQTGGDLAGGLVDHLNPFGLFVPRTRPHLKQRLLN